jgi:hypothetical protein
MLWQASSLRERVDIDIFPRVLVKGIVVQSLPPNNLEAPGLPTKNRMRRGGIATPPA